MAISYLRNKKSVDLGNVQHTHASTAGYISDECTVHVEPFPNEDDYDNYLCNMYYKDKKKRSGQYPIVKSFT